MGKLSQQKKVKRHMVFLPFYSISFRCRHLEGFSFGFVFCFSLSCRFLGTRGDSSLGPRGTVTELPSGTFPGPLQNQKSKIQNPKSGIQNPKSGIQNPKFPIIKNPKSKLFRPDFGDFGFWNLDFGFWNAM